MLRSFVELCWKSRRFGALLMLLAVPLGLEARAQPQLLLAAAANLKPVMEVLVAEFNAKQPNGLARASYAASGKLSTQIREGAPFDLFLAADMAYPQSLVDEGYAIGPVQGYARGRLVIWSRQADTATLTMNELSAATGRIAIANPRHAPYGQRTKQALNQSGIWQALQSRLVVGENVAQAAQYVQSGNANIGIIALSQAMLPLLRRQGHYSLVPQELYAPLDQGMVILRRTRALASARKFQAWVRSPRGQNLLQKYGFETVPAQLQ